MSLIISAAAAVRDVRISLTPQLRTDIASVLVAIDLGEGKNRMGGSILSQVTQQFGQTTPDMEDAAKLKAFVKLVRKLTLAGCVLSYHDRADGGLLATVAEMMFAGHCGVKLTLDSLAASAKIEDVIAPLFNEELGAVLQIRADRVDDVVVAVKHAGLSHCAHFIGEVTEDQTLLITAHG